MTEPSPDFLTAGMAWNGMAGFSLEGCPRDFDGVHVAFTVSGHQAMRPDLIGLEVSQRTPKTQRTKLVGAVDEPRAGLQQSLQQI